MYCDGTRYAATDVIYLLIGKRERVANKFEANNANATTLTNWQDLNYLWVTINSQTGVVNTEPVGAVASTTTTESGGIAAARTLAGQARGLGGR